MPKGLKWVGRSLEDLRAFPEDARREAGHQLNLVQLGLEPDDYRTMPGVGPGVVEIRIHANTEFRVFYVARHAEMSSSFTRLRRRLERLRGTMSSWARND